MSTFNYVASAQAPTAVNAAVKGNFIVKDRIDLIVSKETFVEVYNIENDLLSLVYQFNLYGRIEALETCQMQGRDTCSLFIFTDQGRYCILSYDPIQSTIITEQHGHPGHHPARLADDIFVRTIGRERNLVVASIYSGLLHVFPIAPTPSGKGKAKAVNTLRPEPFAIRIDEFLILSLVALDNEPEPTIAVLYANERKRRFIKTYQLNLKIKSINEQALGYTSNARDSDYLLLPMPAPYFGFCVISDSIITCHDKRAPQNSKSTSINFTIMTAHSEFTMGEEENSIQCFLSDTSRVLYVLRIWFNTNGTAVRIALESLGMAVRASAIVPLPNDRLFLGSAQADSTLIKLDSKPITVLDELLSLAPIVDFCLFDLDKQGRQTMVCCSGADNNGSLRMVQDGVGFLPKTELLMPGIKGVWTLKQKGDSSIDNTMVISTVHGTRILYIEPGTDIVEELSEFSALKMEESTLAIDQVDNIIIHVTPSGVRLVENEPKGALLDEWRPAPDQVITVAAVNRMQCVLSSGRGELLYIEVKNNRLVYDESKVLDHEISCLDISHFEKSYVAVGLWGGQHVQVLRLPDLSKVAQDTFTETLVPRSVVLAELEHVQYLLLTLGDGQLVYYRLGKKGLVDRKQLTLGTHSVFLHKLMHNGRPCIFAASDRPTMITSENNRLTFSGVNLQEIRGCKEFNNPIHQGVIVATDKSLVFGRINPVRKLHITKVPLENETARRVLYHEETKTIAVGTSTVKRNIDDGSESYTGWLRIFDARTLQELSAYNLLQHEVVESMCSIYMAELESEVVFVGTAIVSEQDKDQLPGRVLAFQVMPNYEYKLLDAANVAGVVYSMRPYLGSIIMSVNGSLYFLESFKQDEDSGKKLRLAPKLHANMIALSLDTRNDILLVGDMIHSMSIIKPDDSAERRLKKVASDYNPNYMQTVKILREDLYLGADSSYNFFILRQMSEDARRLEIVGEYHLGELVNCIKQGSISRQPSDIGDTGRLLYGTVGGSIGAITPLEQDQYEFLAVVQQNILNIRPSIGNLEHRVWRMFQNGIRKADSHNFIDGDLIESFLQLSYMEKEMVVKGNNGGSLLPCDVDKLQTIIEELANSR
ncbi:hypothetical protein O0I10_008745 [Lichtheimia ornata]|uniref:DNA damage-binding protein 1 n=1 Tax=Lichtheimia ornata TaxID=688661 RepID=A0AAD7XWR3_9FUNG|nr:uncharacterized protein O0I10_008745 [Lichtheimia ornata]KAJ8655656.1 hypothetical protein O0I10_008745 [Lichtheimia ornata]